ncbi:hypothetical protein FACS189432_02560 [Bacteroidia bacterium]|nr:hypothetical protein FACS189426_00620 [Bacteroidia bacterium]GHT26999.1 hypothetical protein FACS189432_02560 [Bacteroidia bacterium]
MKLYHGSNETIKNPQLLEDQRPLDFGNGFYTTTNLMQCRVFARKVLYRKKSGKAIVSYYEFDESLLPTIKVLQFDGPNKEWLTFITRNRIEQNLKNDYDLIIGPVANDDVYNTLLPYFSGNMSVEIALMLLKPKKLFNQYTFCTDKSIRLLNYVNCEEVNNE